MRKLVSMWGALGMPRAAADGPPRVAASMRRGPILSLILCGVLLVAAIMVGTMLIVGQFRERALSNGERELENTVRLLTRHFDQQLDDLEVPLDDLLAHIRLAGIASADDFRRRMSTPEMHLLMKAKVSGPSEIAGINIYDAGGTLINSSEVSVVPAVNIADRAYFTALKSGAEQQQVELVRSRFSGGWRTVIARRVTGANDEFLGVVSRAISPTKFQDFFSSVVLGESAAIAMFHSDGSMLARYPHAESMIGLKFRNAPLLHKVLTEGGLRTLRVRSPVDDQDRLGSAAPLSRFPIVVVATTTVSAVLADWRLQTRFMIAAAALSALVIALILFLIVRQLARQNRDAQQRLESEKHRLDTALNNMTQGLVLYDASARIIICNRRYIDMYHLSTDIVKPGCHFFDLIRHRKETGSFEGDVEEFCSNILRNVARGKVTHSVMECADGRSVRVVNQPLVQGGWVATIEDITGAPQPRTGARPQLCIPAPDHRPHPDADHRQGRARSPLRAGQPGGRGTIRAVARRHRRQDGARTVPAGGRRHHRRGRRKGPAISGRPVPRRAPVAKSGAGPALHHLEADRNPGSGRQNSIYRQRGR
jgi:PAS domain-containing protein